MKFTQMTSSLFQGILGNLSEIPIEDLEKKYGDFLMSGETIQVGYLLIRDAFLFTDRRLIFIDRQKATGVKMQVNSIYLDTIIDVSVETAGFGVDDSKINITYILSPYFKACHGVDTKTLTQEFPKRYKIQPLYRALQEIAFENHQRINA